MAGAFKDQSRSTLSNMTTNNLFSENLLSIFASKANSANGKSTHEWQKLRISRGEIDRIEIFNLALKPKK